MSTPTSPFVVPSPDNMSASFDRAMRAAADAICAQWRPWSREIRLTDAVVYEPHAHAAVFEALGNCGWDAERVDVPPSSSPGHTYIRLTPKPAPPVAGPPPQ